MYACTGNENFSTFVLGGKGLEDVRDGQLLAQSGKIVISTDVWKSSNNYGLCIGSIDNNFVEIMNVSMCIHSLVHIQL